MGDHLLKFKPGQSVTFAATTAIVGAAAYPFLTGAMTTKAQRNAVKRIRINIRQLLKQKSLYPVRTDG